MVLAAKHAPRDQCGFWETGRALCSLGSQIISLCLGTADHSIAIRMFFGIFSACEVHVVLSQVFDAESHSANAGEPTSL